MLKGVRGGLYVFYFGCFGYKIAKNILFLCLYSSIRSDSFAYLAS